MLHRFLAPQLFHDTVKVMWHDNRPRDGKCDGRLALVHPELDLGVPELQHAARPLPRQRPPTSGTMPPRNYARRWRPVSWTECGPRDLRSRLGEHRVTTALAVRKT